MSNIYERLFQARDKLLTSPDVNSSAQKAKINILSELMIISFKNGNKDELPKEFEMEEIGLPPKMLKSYLASIGIDAEVEEAKIEGKVFLFKRYYKVKLISKESEE